MKPGEYAETSLMKAKLKEQSLLIKKVEKFTGNIGRNNIPILEGLGLAKLNFLLFT